MTLLRSAAMELFCKNIFDWLIDWAARDLATARKHIVPSVLIGEETSSLYVHSRLLLLTLCLSIHPFSTPPSYLMSINTSTQSKQNEEHACDAALLQKKTILIDFDFSRCSARAARAASRCAWKIETLHWSATSKKSKTILGLMWEEE